MEINGCQDNDEKVTRAKELYDRHEFEESFKLFSEAAEGGDTFSLCRKGKMCAHGYGTEKNPDLAFQCFLKASSTGDDEAVYQLGRCYLDGIGTVRDFKKGLSMIIGAANRGLAKAQNEIGYLYATGKHYRKDTDVAYSWFMKAADQNDPGALYNLSVMHMHGKHKDEKKSIDLLRRSAELKNTSAMAALGRHHLRGDGVEQNTELGIELIRCASEMDSVEADTMLGMFYYSGRYVECDYALAEKYLLSGAERGNVTCMEYLGRIYDSDDSGRLDPKEAKYWFTQAADNGSAFAHFSLGRMYFVGRGTKKDYFESNRHFLAAADKGYSQSYVWLGRIRLRGDGTFYSTEEAMKWFIRASDAGDPLGDYEAGMLFIGGNNLDDNDISGALGCFRLGAERGNAQCMYQIGRYYEYCDKEMSSNEAIYWYTKAADKEYVPAIIALADHYASGSFVKQDDMKALYLYQKAFDINDSPVAAANIAMFIEEGRSPKMDMQMVKELYLIAASKGNGFAMLRLHFMAKKENNTDGAVYWLRRAASENIDEAMMALAVAYETGDGVQKSIQMAIEWYHRLSDRGNKAAKGKFEELMGSDYFDEPELHDESLKRHAGESKDIGSLMELGDRAKTKKEKRMWYGFASQLGSKEADSRLSELDASKKKKG